MEKRRMLRSEAADNRPLWSTPKLQELGNLRSLVRVGNANGKSGYGSDGNAACGPEAMVGQSGDCPTPK